MRILYFSRDYSPHDYRFLTSLSNSSDNVAFLRLEDAGRRLEERLLPKSVQVLDWVGGKRLAHWYDVGLLRSLKQVIHTYQPDLIHAGPIQRSAFLVALSGYHPLVSMSWGYDLLHDLQRGAAWSWAARYTLERSTVLIADCDTIRQKAIGLGMKAQNIVIFPWGINLEHFKADDGQARSNLIQRLGWPEDAFIVLSTRNWFALYGVEEVARAFVRASQQNPQLRLVMLGSGVQEALLKQLFQQAFGDEVEKHVFLPGQINNLHLVDYYRSADLYLSASHSDGSSISLLEALGCSCPALVSDIPGNREWINPGEQGWQFPVGNHQALAECLLQVAADRSVLRDMRSCARQTAEARADWNKNFAKLLEAYQLALKQSKP